MKNLLEGSLIEERQKGGGVGGGEGGGGGGGEVWNYCNKKE